MNVAFQRIKTLAVPLRIVSVLVISALFAILPSVNSYGLWVNQGQEYGFFDNNHAGSCHDYDANGNSVNWVPPAPANWSQCPASVMPHTPGNPWAAVDALPTAYIQAGANDVDKAQRFYQYLESEYNTNGANATWRKTGAAFIVRQLLGSTSGSSRTISAPEWNDLWTRLRAAAVAKQINFNASINNALAPYNGYNTFYQQSRNDVAYEISSAPVRQGIEIKNSANVPIFGIWYWCANPVGNLPGLEAAQPYTLNPTITVNPSSNVQAGNPITASPFVTSSGGGTSNNTQWKVTRFIVLNGGTVPGAQVNGTDPLIYYGNNATPGPSGSQNFPPGGPYSLTPATSVAENLAAGDKICYALSVQPYTNADTLNYWSHSLPSCVVVAGKPKVQVWGGDLIVGRASPYNLAATSNVITSTSFSSSTNSTFGSWSEYAIIPSGTVKGMASGSMYVGGSTATDLCSLSVLTISNNDGSGCNLSSIGNYINSVPVPNVASRFPVTAKITVPSIDIDSLTSGQTYSVDNSTLNITSSSSAGSGFGMGKWVVINDPQATVTIKSDITYTSGPLTQLADIPQIVIIAKNILIDESVKNIDAWLIAAGSNPEGYINTCSRVPTGNPQPTLNATICKEPLRINGPVLTNKLYMYRTGGGGGNPAEVFNLRADAYVWASVYSPGNGRVPTVNTKELPPRF